MDRLFEDPVADAIDVIAPAAGAEAIRPAKKLDEDVERPPDGACIDQLLDLSPERGKSQLVADREQAMVVARQCDQLAALIEIQAHRLFQQQVPPTLKHGLADFKMQIGWKHDDAQI